MPLFFSKSNFLSDNMSCSFILYFKNLETTATLSFRTTQFLGRESHSPPFLLISWRLLNHDVAPQSVSVSHFSVLSFKHDGQKLLKISCLLLQSMAGALFLLRPARAFCFASAAVGLRRRPLSMRGSETRLSSSSGT